MKLLFSAPDGDKRTIMSESLFVSYLAYNDVWIREQDIEVSYNHSHGFWDITIYKDSRDIDGNGTKQTRQRKWEEIKKDVKDVLNPYHYSESSWRWPLYERSYNGIVSDDECIPAIRMFIKCL